MVPNAFRPTTMVGPVNTVPKPSVQAIDRFMECFILQAGTFLPPVDRVLGEPCSRTTCQTSAECDPLTLDCSSMSVDRLLSNGQEIAESLIEWC